MHFQLKLSCFANNFFYKTILNKKIFNLWLRNDVLNSTFATSDWHANGKPFWMHRPTLALSTTSSRVQCSEHQSWNLKLKKSERFWKFEIWNLKKFQIIWATKLSLRKQILEIKKVNISEKSVKNCPLYSVFANEFLN